MAKTAVADVIIPTEFEKYAIERTAELSRFGDSGIVEHDPAFDEIAMQGGREVKMPFWKDLTATRQLLSDSAPLTVNKITSDQDIARLHNDAQVWSVNHLAKVVSGDDPLQAIVDLVAGYWARTDEGLVISCLKGVFGAATMAGAIGFHLLARGMRYMSASKILVTRDLVGSTKLRREPDTTEKAMPAH